jgi:hypothetical protein
MNWPDGLGLWPANAPDTQPESCDDCHGDGLFCKACDQRKSDCECKLGDIDVDRWLKKSLPLIA